jgi:molybdopterin synthase sulfurtransferase
MGVAMSGLACGTDTLHAAVAACAPNAPTTQQPVPTGFRSDLVRWRQLVSVPWLAALLAHEVVAAPPTPDWLLLEVACDGLAQFVGGHIASARYLDTRQLEHLPFWNKLPDAELLRVLQHIGIQPARTIILYGRNPLAAARVAQLLLYAGMQDVRLLDGGLAAWCAAGHALQTGVASVLASLHPWPAPFPARPDYLLDTAQVRAMLGRQSCALVSIRTHGEFVGETSGYSYIAARGEIPGARWGHAGRDGDVNSMNNFQDELGRMKPAADIAAQWRGAGIGPEMHVVFYCGTGWRASLAFFYAWLMGWEHISVYDGGWFEWSSNVGNPVICRTAQPIPAPPQSGPAPQSRPT